MSTTSSNSIHRNVLTVIAVLFFFGIAVQSSAQSWYNNSWSFRKSHTITGSATAGTNYQVRIIAHKAAGTDAGTDIYLGTSVRDDFGDVRFTAADGTTLLDYWMETGSVTNGSQAAFWVEVAADLATSQTIYMYYGNGTAATTSNGKNTFLLFDDFTGTALDATLWTKVGGATPSFAGGIMTVAANAVDPSKIIATGGNITVDNRAMVARFQVTGGVNADERAGVSVRINRTTAQGYNYVFHNFAALSETKFLDDYQSWDAANYGTWTKNNYYTMEAFQTGLITYGRTNFGTWNSKTWITNRAGNPALNIGSFDGTTTWDWAFIRKCIVTEPAHGAYGTQESLPAPVATAATNLDVTSFSANWNAVNTATGYRIDVSAVNTFATFVPGFNNKDVGNVLTTSVTGLTTGTTYYYRVRAYNAIETSANSNVIATNTSGNGDYRSRQSGNWNATTTWQILNGGTWVNANNAPTSGNGIISIRNGHTVTVTANVTADQLVVDAGGILVVNYATSGYFLNIANGTGTDLTVNGLMNYLDYSVQLATSATMTIGSTGTYQNSYTGGVIPTATWAAGSTCLVTGATSAAPANMAQAFSNFTWNCSSQANNFDVTIYTVQGNLNILNTNGKNIRLTNDADATLNIGGDFLLSGTSRVNLSRGTGILTMNVAGNFTIDGGTLTVSNGSTSNVNFNGTGVQLFKKPAGTIARVINFAILPGSTVDFGTSIIDGTTGTFTLNPGGTLLTANTDAAGALTTTGTFGTIQAGGARSYSSAANYIFNGGALQSTGNGLPATVSGNVTINNPGGVILTNAATTLSGLLSITQGWLDISGKNLVLAGGPNSYFGSENAATASIKGNASATLTINGSGPLGSALTFKNDINTETFLQTFTLNRTSGKVTLNSDLKIGSGGMALTNGVFTVAAARKLDVKTANTTLGTAECLVLTSDATGTASFIDNGTINGTGTARIERFLAKYNVVSDMKFHFLSCPVTTQAIMPEFQTMTNTTDDFYKWDEPGGQWINSKQGSTAPFTWNTAFGSGNGAFRSGDGYLVAYPADVTKKFIGKPYSSTGLTMTASNTTAGGGWNLFGNPFPSPIDWAVVAKGSGMDGALYYYDNASPGYKYYVDLTGGLGTGSQFVPAMQGFMVHAKTSGTKTIIMSNANRVHQGLTMFYKSAPLTENVLNISVSGTTSRDDARVCFYDKASAEFDGDFDAYKLFSYSAARPELYSLTPDSTQLAINTLPFSQMSGVIPVGFMPGTAGDFTFAAEGIGSFPSATYIFLDDLVTGTSQKLNDNPLYTFTADPRDKTTRFQLRFQDATAVPEAGTKETFRIMQNNGNITLTTEQAVNAEILVTNMLGQVVLRSETNGNVQTTLNAGNLPSGVYVVSLVGNGRVMSEKIVLK